MIAPDDVDTVNLLSFNGTVLPAASACRLDDLATCSILNLGNCWSSRFILFACIRYEMGFFDLVGVKYLFDDELGVSVDCEIFHIHFYGALLQGLRTLPCC